MFQPQLTLLSTAILSGGLLFGSVAYAAPQAGDAVTVAQSIDLPAQPLQQALNQLAEQTGTNVLAPQALVAGKQGRSVRGSLSVEQALNKLLEGSGLAARQTAQGSFVIYALAPSAAQVPPQLDQVMVVGTRRTDLTALQSSSPVDTISANAIQETGFTNLSQALQALVPSFNYPLVNGVDGLSSFRAAALRGLSPDQTLVLINGKRRHVSAFVNNKPFFGRGSNAADLNTIPISAIERVEVLRDGASAQYGSDAIAGVINVVLKERDSGGEVNTTMGKFTKGDGFSKNVETWKGFTLPGDGFLTLSGDWSNKKRTYPSGKTDDSVYFWNANDPREATANREYATGSPALDDYNLALNAESSVTDQVQLYGFATYGHRISHSQNAYRYPYDQQGRNWLSVYPEGFQPWLDLKSEDYETTFGSRFGDDDIGKFDLAASYGRSDIEYILNNSINPSFGPDSQRRFHAGGYTSDQTSLTLDYVKDLQWSLTDFPVTLAAGAAWRKENYDVNAGEYQSWARGPYEFTDVPRRGPGVDPGPNPNAGFGPAAPGYDVRAGVGSQSFPGYQPGDAGSYDRNVKALYVSLENNLTEKLQMGVAARYEKYSDFGSTRTGKVSARYEFNPMFALRATANTGFRAPSLGQIGHSYTQSTWNGSVMYDSRTFPVDHPVARLLGAQDLKPEKSTNFSLGAVFTPLPNASLTVDVYQIKLRDRVTLSENQTNLGGFLNPLGYDVSAASFYTNGLDTKTKGVDVVGNYVFDLKQYGRLAFSGGYNWNDTEILKLPQTPSQLLAINPNAVLVNRETEYLITDAAPSSKLNLTAHYSYGDWGLRISETRFGEFKSADAQKPPRPGYDQTFGAQWVTDASVSYQVTKNVRVDVGGNNIFDSFPDKVNKQRLNTNSRTVYSLLSPGGYEGAYYYANLNVKF